MSLKCMMNSLYINHAPNDMCSAWALLLDTNVLLIRLKENLRRENKTMKKRKF